MRILIIEDDSDTTSFLKKCLKEKGFAVDTADDGETGSYFARTNDYDLILLDCGLPKKDGKEVCGEIRSQEHPERKHTPVIMISAAGQVADKVGGLAIGADDYITKPFFFDEIFARIQAVLRRPHTRQSPIFSLADLSIDCDKQRVARGKDCIYLTRKEFSLLEFLMRNSGKVVSRSSLAEHVWDMNADPFSNTIETHILNLRNKVDRKYKTKLIHSVPGRGYKIDMQR